MRAGGPCCGQGSVRQRHIRSPSAKPGGVGPDPEIGVQKGSLKFALVAAALTLGLAGMAAAHHSGAAYDMEHPRTMEGTVKTVNWTNPHITFVVEADAKDGHPAASW